MYHSFFIHSPVDGHLGRFHVQETASFRFPGLASFSAVRFTLTACITFRKQCLWVGEPLKGTLMHEHKVLTTGLRCTAFPNCVLPIRLRVFQAPPSSGTISSCVLQWPLALHLTPVNTTSNFTVQVHLSSSSSPHVQDSPCCSWSSPHEPPLWSGPFNPHSWQNLFSDIRTAHSQVPMLI